MNFNGFGVWLRTQIETETKIAVEAAKHFIAHEGALSDRAMEITVCLCTSS